MAIIELDDTIREKLRKSFNVSKTEIDSMLSFFNSQISPEIKTHYLSHLVSTVSDAINNIRKEEIKHALKKLKGDINYSCPNNLRLFTIELQPLEENLKSKKAFCKVKQYGCIIYYASFLGENEKRFAIAHELGHIVDSLLLHREKDKDSENRASLFAYIALLDKNNFYKNNANTYISKTDIELFNDYINIIHT